LESLLFGVVPHDPLTLAGATVTLAVVVVAATLVPARRASRIQPASALRTD
jgi:putative ABC transport system permease protein